MVLRCLLLGMVAASLVPGQSADRLRFRVSLGANATSVPVSGRLIVFMTDDPQPQERLYGSFLPGRVWVAAREVASLSPGATVELDPDQLASPRAFSQAPAGRYQFMAMLDRNHRYAYSPHQADVLYGPVVRLDQIDPAHTAPVALSLTVREDHEERASTADVKVVNFVSPALSAFWGRPITMRASVALPDGYEKNGARRYPTVYVIHGFGGDYRDGFRMASRMQVRDGIEAVIVFLDGSCPGGHHEFADSVNNGPWGRALTTEFIPYLERTFRLIAKPRARFLTGHSSGGWSSLWLQVTYPDLFGGTWSTAPDPVDFRSFTGINVTPGSTGNAYRTPDGKPRNVARKGGRELASWEQYAKYEAVLGDYGGQAASFDWVFSPRGEDGRPMRMFDRETGALDARVIEAWQKYDIRRTLEREWRTKAPKLAGKLHIICGDADTFHLNEAVSLLCGFLKEKGSDATCELVPGRDHSDLYEPYKTYPDGLERRISREMRGRFEAASGR